jgi:formylglycine-generating enzyme required for sulfatase activity
VRRLGIAGMLLLLLLALAACGGEKDKKPPTDVPTPTATAIPAGSPNAGWTPIVQDTGGIPVVYVPAGCFMMGSAEIDDAQPVHAVCLSAYWIGQTEVTNTQYAVCVDAGGCTPPVDRRYFDDPAYADYPVVYVTWSQARDYAAWIGGGLPTEAQWEYTARGPEGWDYPWGNTFVAENLVYKDNSGGQAAEVGSRPGGVSWVGALDMSGNVWEWTADWRGDYPAAAQTDPTGPASGTWRVVRGGAWNFSYVFARGAYRFWSNPSDWYAHYGFRVVVVSPGP